MWTNNQNLFAVFSDRKCTIIFQQYNSFSRRLHRKLCLFSGKEAFLQFFSFQSKRMLKQSHSEFSSQNPVNRTV